MCPDGASDDGTPTAPSDSGDDADAELSADSVDVNAASTVTARRMPRKPSARKKAKQLIGTFHISNLLCAARTSLVLAYAADAWWWCFDHSLRCMVQPFLEFWRALARAHHPSMLVPVLHVNAVTLSSLVVFVQN
jgi:hypothetical protein